MVPFVKALIEGCEKYDVERVLYQAGSLSPAPGQALSMMTRIMRVTMAPMMGNTVMLKENDKVIEMLNDSKLAWVCARPGLIEEALSRGVLTTSLADPGGNKVTFIDLAKYNLTTVQSSSKDRSAPYVAY